MDYQKLDYGIALYIFNNGVGMIEVEEGELQGGMRSDFYGRRQDYLPFIDEVIRRRDEMAERKSVDAGIVPIITIDVNPTSVFFRTPEGTPQFKTHRELTEEEMGEVMEALGG